jgi:cyclopropane fatty-acyl-phospholipid synthase-like methyltransferase
VLTQPFQSARYSRILGPIAQTAFEPPTRIFPGAHTPALEEMMVMFGAHGFAVTDVEDLRRHYVATLVHLAERRASTTSP